MNVPIVQTFPITAITELYEIVDKCINNVGRRGDIVASLRVDGAAETRQQYIL